MKGAAFDILDFTASRGEQSPSPKELDVDLRFVQRRRCLQRKKTKDPVLEILDFTAPRG
eukprot:NODE_165_length_1917_cov_259.501074.p8 GENE.NODE_165_length_1917_cov_259.501074~~NODE_165_length_1917_cov_259.501074.p8  ORF type:complete len:59 (-),score=6.11 NODE_165_length_1917_cov_259.501074:1571-1747(-)